MSRRARRVVSEPPVPAMPGPSGLIGRGDGDIVFAMSGDSVTIARREALRLLGAAPAAALAAERRPNFIFILCDDLGWGDLPAYGHRNVNAHGGWIVRGELKTPRLDRMAREGTLFTQFYVASGVCSPSRAAIMTGRFPGEVGIHDYLASEELNRQRGCVNFLDPEIPTVTSLLKDAGYATAHFGKWHLGGRTGAPPPQEYGIDEYRNCRSGPGGRVTSSAQIADATIEFIERHREGPFYVNAWLYDPHSPLHPTEAMLAEYEELTPRWGDHYGALQVWYSVLTEMDRQVGRILDRLDDLGLSENTVVVFTSDNGPESGLIPFVSHYGNASSAGPFRGLKRSLYEGGIREPFIVRWKGHAPANAVNRATVLGGVDWMPTVCHLAGVEAPADIRGEALLGSFLGESLTRSRPLMWENRFPVYGHVLDKSPMLAVRSGRWKLLMNPDRSRVELYDIPADPSEMTNLASREPETARRLASQLLAWHETLPTGPVDPAAGKAGYPWPASRE